MTNKLTYRQWMQAVDAEVEKRTTLTLDLLPDWLSRDAYEDGVSVAEAAEQLTFLAGIDEGVLVDEA